MQFDPLDNIAEFFESKINVNKMIDTRENPVSPPDLEIINQAAAALTPAEQIKASKTLKLNIMKQIHESSDIPNVKRGRTITMTGPGWKKIASIAALLLVMLAIVPIFGPRLFNPNAKAMSLLNTSIEAILNIKSMVVSYQVRSVPGDNLDLIDTKGDFIDYKLYKEFTPAEKWRIEKPGLAVAMDGKNQFKFMEKTGIGYVGSPQAGFVDWMRILLDPGKILQEEKASAARHKDHYTVETKNNETILTVKAKALGNFKNTYLLNASIPESNNRRIYHFDKQTNRLLSLEIFITEHQKEVLVLKINTIKYDEAIAPETFKITLPEGTKWVELKDLEPKKENATTAKNAGEAAQLWWESISKNDWSVAYKLDPSLEQSSNLESFKKEYGSLQVISIGKPFKSGIFVGEFVPYEVKLKSGKTLKFNLALRNDNDEKIWQVDGGY